MTADATGLVAAAALGLLGLGLAALIGRLAPPRWAPGLTGAVAGGFGIGALQLTGLGDLGLLPMAGVLLLYGALVGGATLLARRKSG
jgi:hypothetical protein